ncbi:MAG: DUF58 domain-containing protein [Planctomycetota bacterium]
MSTATEPLLTPALLARLERLELVSRKVFRGRMKGERRSRRKGQSVEFADFRNYVAGDDLRLIDWNLYARLDQLFLKMFLEEEDLHFFALIDASDSMRFGTPTKLHVAKQIAAALGYVGMCRADRVQVTVLGPDGARAPTLRGKSSLHRLLGYLDTVGGPVSDVRSENDLGSTAAHNISLEEGVKEFSLRNSGTGVAVLISDMMDKQGYESALRLLIGRRMDVYVIHVLTPEEIDPPLRGDYRLIDAEDNDQAEITINPAVLQRYKQTLTHFTESLKQFCNQRSIGYIPVRTDTPIDQVATSYLQSRGVLR